ncbi:MAG: FAD binding domain-containing protein [Chloroflexota bacterium]
MIIEYHRPETLDEALKLLARSDPVTVPLGGGTVLNQPSDTPVAVVDLQALGLDAVESGERTLEIGATVTLQSLLKVPEIPPALIEAIRHEATYNLRQMATVAGTLVAADGRSPFATAMLALDAQAFVVRHESAVSAAEQISLGDLLPLREEKLPKRLITQITIPANIKLAYQYVARTPADLPIVCAAVAQWPSGRTRVALGGYGSVPLMAMDGPEPAGAEIAARDAYSEAGDQWASAGYRSDVAAILTKRCLQEIAG